MLGTCIDAGDTALAVLPDAAPLRAQASSGPRFQSCLLHCSFLCLCLYRCPFRFLFLFGLVSAATSRLVFPAPQLLRGIRITVCGRTAPSGMASGTSVSPPGAILGPPLEQQHLGQQRQPLQYDLRHLSSRPWWQRWLLSPPPLYKGGA